MENIWTNWEENLHDNGKESDDWKKMKRIQKKKKSEFYSVLSYWTSPWPKMSLYELLKDVKVGASSVDDYKPKVFHR